MSNKKNSNDYIIFQTGGKQYIAEENTVVSIEKVQPTSEGKTFKIDKVLAYSKDDVLTVGAPYANATATAEILADELDKKVRVFKFKKKTGYKKKQGHRQTYSTIRITNISFDA